MKRKTVKMNRVIAVVVSAAMALSIITSGFAMKTAQAAESDGHDPMEDVVLVMFDNESTDIVTDTGAKTDENVSAKPVAKVLTKSGIDISKKSGVQKLLTSGRKAVSDVEVDDVWVFDAGEDTSVVAAVSAEDISGEKLAAKLNQRSDVYAAEKNSRVHALSVTNDTYSDFQWSMQDKDNVPHIGYQWNKTGITGSDEKIVAVVDTGVDYTHPDLKDNMWVNTHSKLKGIYGFDFINGDPDPMDDQGHGTHCAGIIGAVGDNGIGISGVNKNIKIMGLKTLDSNGSAWLSHEIAAYNYINSALDLGEPIVAVNNSWAGGDESMIFLKLIDIIGSKGAATVCAAGNEASNNDENPIYPANLNSPYIISVGSIKSNGELSSFSNYGESVDIAAPGSTILSTVPYNNYLPSIYGDHQDDVSAKFNDFEDAGNTWGIPDKVYVNGDECVKNGDVFEGPDGQEITLERIDEDHFNPSGHSLKMSATGLNNNDLVCFSFPYTVEDNATINPYSAIEYMAFGSGNTDGSIFGLTDVPKGTDKDVDSISNFYLAGGVIWSEEDEWEFLNYNDKGELQAGDEREVLVLLFAAKKGDYTIKMDDFALSRQDIEEDAFGKYGFMSGTSMAAPFITGAVALKVMEAEKNAPEGEKVNIADLLNEMSEMAKDDPVLNIGSKGSFDFKVTPTVLPPKIGKVKADIENGIVRILGSGFTPGEAGFKVEAQAFGDDDYTEVPVLEGGNSNEICIDGKGYINNCVDIRVTSPTGRESEIKDVFIVEGKAEYNKASGLYYDLSGEAYTTDGTLIYSVNSQSREISAFDPDIGANSRHTIAVVDPSVIFDVGIDPNVNYGMLFGDDLVYSNNHLYSVVEYGKADMLEVGYNSGFSYNSNRYKKTISSVNQNGVSYFDGPFSVYDGETKLISVKTDAEDDDIIDDLGELPDELEGITDYAMAAYNGRIWFIGGYRLTSNGKVYSDKVFIYDPERKEWSVGPTLPSPRAGGMAIQAGSDLIYTLGWKEDVDYELYKYGDMPEYPVNLIYNGSAWKECGADTAIKQCYGVNKASIGLTAAGILYTGALFLDYGDTVIFDPEKEEYKDTGYNFAVKVNDGGIDGLVVGDTFYGISRDDNSVYTLPVDSGLIEVSATETENGEIDGTGSYLPGNTAKITVRADEDYRIKSLTVNGKAISAANKQTDYSFDLKDLLEDQSVVASFEKYVVATPTPAPTAQPTEEPWGPGLESPSPSPTKEPEATTEPTAEPTAVPTAEPTAVPTSVPDAVPTATPTNNQTADQKNAASTANTTFKVTAKKKGKGKITGTGSYQVGKVAKIKIKSNKGWYIKSIKVDGLSIKVKKKLTSKTIKIKASMLVKVVFKKK